MLRVLLHRSAAKGASAKAEPRFSPSQAVPWLFGQRAGWDASLEPSWERGALPQRTGSSVQQQIPAKTSSSQAASPPLPPLAMPRCRTPLQNSSELISKASHSTINAMHSTQSEHPQKLLLTGTKTSSLIPDFCRGSPALQGCHRVFATRVSDLLR